MRSRFLHPHLTNQPGRLEWRSQLLPHAMQRHHLTKLFFAGAAALWLAIGSSVFGQGITTSDLSGFVTDKQNNRLAE